MQASICFPFWAIYLNRNKRRNRHKGTKSNLVKCFSPDISGALTRSACCGKVMRCYQNSIKNFSWLISACGATTFYQPSGWANFPSMIPDPSVWGTEASAHTHSLHNARLVCLLHEMIPGYRLHQWTSLWERSTLLKTRSPPFMKRGHLHWTIQSTFPCKHSLLRVWITSTSLKSFLLMAVFGMGQGSHAHPADWRKGDRNTPQIKTRLNLISHSFSFHCLCHHHTPNLRSFLYLNFPLCIIHHHSIFILPEQTCTRVSRQ